MITVINIIPQILSGETNQDSEPNLAVNPANPLQIAASAFTPNPMGGANAPIYVSIDGGSSWSLNNIVPSAGSLGTGDITLRFAGTSNRLFASILDGTTSLGFEVHRTNNFTSATPMTPLQARVSEDQPYIQATTVMGGADTGKDRIYVGVNDFNAPSGKTATIELSLDAGSVSPVFSSVRVEKRVTSGQNGPQIRPTVHSDGTIYAIFHGWRAFSGGTVTADVVVVRDDSWATGATPFTALMDGDGFAGKRVVTSINFPWSNAPTIGQERLGGDLSIAVDPRNSSILYIAYCKSVAGIYTIHVRSSTDRGVTWSTDLLTVSKAKNPALAINSLGKVAIAYQQVTGSGASERWETHYRTTTNGGSTWTNDILATTSSTSPSFTFLPYLGDYIHMMAVGKDFYGIFSASNFPDTANFPQGVTFQRNHNFATHQLFANDGITLVNPSIDPYFFKVTELSGSSHSDFYLRDWTNTATDHDMGLEPSTSPWFYVGSDVWNQRNSSIAIPFVNDQPQNEDPRNNATNFAFARVSRNDSASAETVNVDFLVAQYGTGSPFGVVASTTVNFAVGETAKIATAPWNLPATSSTHLCLAAQISTPSDPFVAPGLNGNTPGWPTTDLMVINDNNKAQRNMGVSYLVTGSGGVYHGIIHNAAKFERDFVLRFIPPKGDPINQIKNPVVSIIGQDSIKLREQQDVVIKNMKPGEKRLIALSFDILDAKLGSSIPVDFLEIVEGKAINGFRINIISASPRVAIKECLELQLSIFNRVAAGLGFDTAKDAVKITQTLLKQGVFSNLIYITFVKKIAEILLTASKLSIDKSGMSDSLNIKRENDNFKKAVDGGKFNEIFTAHGRLLQKTDALLSTFLR